MRFYLYAGRHGQRELVEATRDGWDYLVRLMERDNGYSVEDLREEVWVEGSFTEGFLHIDEGGRIDEITLTELSERLP